MYRITKEMAYYLLDHSKNSEVPGIERDVVKPYVCRNTNSIGSINPLLVFGSDCKYLVDSDLPDGGLDNGTGLSGYWLYTQADIKKVNDVIEIPRSSIDRYTTDTESVVDVSDCAIELPSPIDKLVCKKVDSLDRLFDLEPELRKCIDEKKETDFGNYTAY